MFQNDIAELSVSDRIATVNKRLQSTTSKLHNDRFSKTVMSDEDLICFMNQVGTLRFDAVFRMVPESAIEFTWKFGSCSPRPLGHLPIKTVVVIVVSFH